MSAGQDLSNLSFPSSDWITEVSKGNIPNHRFLKFSGENTVVGDSEENMWNEGGLYYFPTSASIMTLSSDNANDTSAGTGARVVIIRGLDSNYDEISEEITLNGQTPVNSVNSYFRINFLDVKIGATGTTGTNEGNIYFGTGTVTAGKPANVFGLIDPNKSTSEMGFYTVPNGKEFILYDVFYSVDAGKSAVFRIKTTINGTSFKLSTTPISQLSISRPLNPPVVYASKTDIELLAESTSGGGNDVATNSRASGILYTK